MSTYQTRDGRLQLGWYGTAPDKDDYDTMTLYMMRKRWIRDKRRIKKLIHYG